MPSHLGIRQMRAEASSVVRRAGAGEHLIITIGGRPIACLGPLTGLYRQVGLQDELALGLIIAPRRTGGWLPRDPVPIWMDLRFDHLLRSVR